MYYSLHNPSLADLNKADWSANMHYSWFHSKTKCLPLWNAACCSSMRQTMRTNVAQIRSWLHSYKMHLVFPFGNQFLFIFLLSHLPFLSGFPFSCYISPITLTCSRLFPAVFPSSTVLNSGTRTSLLYYLSSKVQKQIWNRNDKALFETFWSSRLQSKIKFIAYHKYYWLPVGCGKAESTVIYF